MYQEGKKSLAMWGLAKSLLLMLLVQSEHLADYSDFCSVQHRAIHIISELEQKSRPFATFLMVCACIFFYFVLAIPFLTCAL